MSLAETGTDADAKVVRTAALSLLARREHSRMELARKLEVKGYAAVVVGQVLSSLEGDGYLSDARFAEAYVRVRSERGYGPMRIRAELRERGVADAIIAASLAPYQDAWLTQLERIRAKRFGRAGDFAERARQTRFFQARGFTMEQISAVLAGGKTRA